MPTTRSRVNRSNRLPGLAEAVFVLGTGWWSFTEAEQAEYRRLWAEHGRDFLMRSIAPFALRKFGQPGVSDADE
jgi:hypothetical protein